MTPSLCRPLGQEAGGQAALHTAPHPQSCLKVPFHRSVLGSAFVNGPWADMEGGGMGPVEPAGRAEGWLYPVGSKPGTAHPGAPPPHPLQSGTLHCAMPQRGWDGASPPGPDRGQQTEGRRVHCGLLPWPSYPGSLPGLGGEPGQAQVVTPRRGAGELQDGVEPDPPPHPCPDRKVGEGQQLVQRTAWHTPPPTGPWSGESLCPRPPSAPAVPPHLHLVPGQLVFSGVWLVLWVSGCGRRQQGQVRCGWAPAESVPPIPG